MTSLSEVYRPDAQFQTSLRRLYAGLGLFAAGALLLVASIVVGTTGVVEPLVVAREWAGVLAGIGVPAVFLGIFAILPSGRTTRIAAAIGAALSLLGVALFIHAFPCQWSGTNCLGPNQSILTLPVSLIYFGGAGTTLWCLFTGIANFKSRNNPGGTARVEVTAQGETRVIEVPKSELSKFSGSMGVLGDPTEDIEPPDRPGARSSDDGSSVLDNDDESGVVSDGGSASTNDISDDILVGGSSSSSDRGFTDSSTDDTVSTGPSTSPGSKPTRRDAGNDDQPNRADSVGTVEDSGGGRAQSGGTTSGGSSRGTSGGGSTGGTSSSGSTGGTSSSGSSRGTSGGGSTGGPTRRDDDWEPSGVAPATSANDPDRDSYCGSCRHFEYFQTDTGMQPYCHAHSEVMDDMEACDDYSSRTP